MRSLFLAHTCHRCCSPSGPLLGMLDMQGPAHHAEQSCKTVWSPLLACPCASAGLGMVGECVLARGVGPLATFPKEDVATLLRIFE